MNSIQCDLCNFSFGKAIGELPSILSQKIYQLVMRVLENIFFSGQNISLSLKAERIDQLVAKGAEKIDCSKDLDALFLKASQKTDLIIVHALTRSAQRLLPQNYEHLKEAADVVLWNPSKKTAKQYEEDLNEVITKVRNLHPNKKIAIIARCATVDPTISVAAKQNDPNISLILDRGYGNVLKLARSLTIFSKLPLIRNILQKEFNCEGEKKIANIPGPILFTYSENDQLLGGNLMKDLIEARGNHPVDRGIELENSDHWTPWSQTTHQKIHDFLGIKANVDAFPMRHDPPSFFKRKILPIFIQSWC